MMMLMLEVTHQRVTHGGAYHRPLDGNFVYLNALIMIPEKSKLGRFLKPLPVGTGPVLTGLGPGTGCDTGPPVTGDPQSSLGTADLAPGTVASEWWNTWVLCSNTEEVAAGCLCCLDPRSFSRESHLI